MMPFLANLELAEQRLARAVLTTVPSRLEGGCAEREGTGVRLTRAKIYAGQRD